MWMRGEVQASSSYGKVNVEVAYYNTAGSEVGRDVVISQDESRDFGGCPVVESVSESGCFS